MGKDIRKEYYSDEFNASDSARKTKETNMKGTVMYECPFFRQEQPEGHCNRRLCPYGKGEECSRCSVHNSFKEGWNDRRREFLNRHMQENGVLPYKVGNNIVEL